MEIWIQAGLLVALLASMVMVFLAMKASSRMREDSLLEEREKLLAVITDLRAANDGLGRRQQELVWMSLNARIDLTISRIETRKARESLATQVGLAGGMSLSEALAAAKELTNIA